MTAGEVMIYPDDHNPRIRTPAVVFCPRRSPLHTRRMWYVHSSVTNKAAKTSCGGRVGDIRQQAKSGEEGSGLVRNGGFGMFLFAENSLLSPHAECSRADCYPPPDSSAEKLRTAASKPGRDFPYKTPNSDSSLARLGKIITSQSNPFGGFEAD